MRHSNELSKAAGFPEVYVDINPDLDADTGEAFLWDYFIAEREREKQPNYTNNQPNVYRCTCTSCASRQKTC